MVGVESPAPPAPTPIGARLAARGVRPRKVSAKRSWPPGCGRFPAAPPVPEAGDGKKAATDGAVEGRAEDAGGLTGDSPAACNGGILHAPQLESVVGERKEGREAQPHGNGASDVQGEIRAIEAKPLAFAVPQSFAVAANGVVENGHYGADSLPVEGQRGQESRQLVREDDIRGNRDGRAMGNSLPVEGQGDQESRQLVREDDTRDNRDGRAMGNGVVDNELERNEGVHDGGRKKRWLTSVVNLPPKRRAVSAIRKYPPGCGRTAVTGTSSGREDGLVLEVTPISFARVDAADTSPTIPVSGCGASPVFRQDAANEELEGKRGEVEGTNKASNTNQETGVVPDDFVGVQQDSTRRQNVATKDSPKLDSIEKMDSNRSLHEGKRASLVAGTDQVRSKGSSRQGTSKAHGRGLLGVKTKGKRLESVKMNETLLDGAWASGEGTMGNKALGTQRGVVRSNINTKQGMAAHMLKQDVVGNDSLNRSPKDSKCGNHVVTDQITENDDLDLVTDRLIVQALMAPDKCPWAQGRRSVGSVSRSLTTRSKLKKNVATPRKVFPPKATPSASTMHVTIKDKQDSSSEDDDNSLALVVHERKNELCVTLPPCAPSGDQSADARSRVRKLLKLFQLICRKLMQAEEQHIRSVGRIDIEAVNAIKNCYPGYTKPGPIVGNVPGVEVGDEFHFRVELSMVGLHRPYQGGIDTTNVNGILIAISIVASGGYPDELSSSDVLIYTGSGGKAIGNKEAEDQKLQGGNLGLKNCIKTKTPVRVTHGFKGQNRGEVGHSKSKQISTYTYDGLYVVEDCWQAGEKGSMVFKYKLQRIPGQAELALHIVKETRNSKVRRGLCLPDISQGKESIPICVINTIDDTRPAAFEYITQVIYPPSCAKELPRGCDCTNGCSDSNKCACAVKNGGEIPFNFNGAIVQAKPLIYECGPSCRCPPKCHNRVSQHGVKIPLEIFKAGKTGWGVRSLSSISSGSFVCEYAGELLQDTEAEKRENDEYLFDIGHNYDDEELWKGLPAMIPGLESSTSETMEGAVGLTIDAAKCGNVGRFINHSCSPNLYAQNVLWDHDDKRMPHIMFFAAENIPPLQELTYHYNYTIGQVRDKNNQEKEKQCLCGASDCCGRLY